MNRLILSAPEQKNYLAGKEFDWYNNFFQSGIRQNHDFSLSRGNSNFKYYWSAGYTDNNGIMVGDRYKQFRSRVNVDANISSFLSVGLNAQFSNKDLSSVPADFSQLYKQSPYGEMYNDDGSIKWYPNDDIIATNPFLYSTYRDNLDKEQSIFATIYAELKLPLNISYRASFTNQFLWSKQFYFNPLETISGFNDGGFGSRTNYSTYDWTVDNLIKWNKTIADIHNIDITLLYNTEKYQDWLLLVFKQTPSFLRVQYFHIMHYKQELLLN